MAGQTGSTYISGIMIDGVEVPTAIMGFSADIQKKREYYCHSVSVYGGIRLSSSYIYSVARAMSTFGFGGFDLSSPELAEDDKFGKTVKFFLQ